jgi:hypothetical protein
MWQPRGAAHFESIFTPDFWNRLSPTLSAAGSVQAHNMAEAGLLFRFMQLSIRFLQLNRESEFQRTRGVLG